MTATTELTPLSESSAAPAQLAAEIRSRYRGLVRELRIELAGGGLILHGRAASYHGKQLAQHEAIRRTGLVLVANRIVVAPPGGE